MALPLTALAPILTGVLGAGTGILGSRSTNRTNRDIARETNQANIAMQRETNQQQMDMFNQQNVWNLQHWQRTNEYNSPAAQLQRYKDAGLNPALMYGNADPGNASGLSSPQAPKLTAPQSQPWTENNPLDGFSLMPMLSMYYDSRKQQAEINKMENESNLISERRLTEMQNRMFSSVTHDWNKQRFERESKLAPFQQKMLEGQVNGLRMDNQYKMYELNRKPFVDEQQRQVVANQILLQAEKIAEFQRSKVMHQKQLSKMDKDAALQEINVQLLQLKLGIMQDVGVDAQKLQLHYDKNYFANELDYFKKKGKFRQHRFNWNSFLGNLGLQTVKTGASYLLK